MLASASVTGVGHEITCSRRYSSRELNPRRRTVLGQLDEHVEMAMFLTLVRLAKQILLRHFRQVLLLRDGP